MLALNDVGLALLCCVVSALLTGLAVRVCRRWNISADRAQGVQRVHRHWAPRIGGLPIFLTLGLACLFWRALPERNLALLLLASALPAFAAGAIEDIWYQVGARVRLFATFASAWVAWMLFDARLTHVDVAGIDWLLANVWIFAFLFTAFAVGGVAHSINLIDGFNGLSGFYCVICLVAFYIVGHAVDDALIQSLALITGGALMGFLAWNYPFGRVFLGDAGAYVLGFLLGEMSVLLVARNPEVSPWFCMLLLAYPIWDTLFSSYRREVKQRSSWSAADTLHLHHLIYRRLVRPFAEDAPGHHIVPNSQTSVYVWVLGLLCAGPALLFWDSTPVLVGFTLLFGLSYSGLYARLVRFRGPRLLRLGRRAPAAPALEAVDDEVLPAE